VGRPAASAFAWINQGSATYSEHANGPITLSLPPSSGDQIRGIGQAPPGSTPYTLTAKVDSVLWGANYAVAGVYILDSAGKLLLFGEVGSSGNPAAIFVNHQSSFTSFNSTAKSVSVNGPRTLWYRIKNDGTNWNFYVSSNGADWTPVYSEPLTQFLGSTITSIGVCGNNANTSALPLQISLWSYELVTGSGTNSSWQ
jgi:hypothetical protein